MLALTACTATPTPPPPTPAAPTSESREPTPASATSPPPTSASPPTPTAPAGLIVYVTEATNVESDPAWDAVQALAQGKGWQAEIVFAADLAERMAATPDLVVSVSAALSMEMVAALARDQPGTHFVLLGGSPPAETLANVLFLGGPESRHDQAGFLAGVAAGFATGTERVAVFSDTTTVEGRKYRNGFVSGVRYACPKCRIDTIDLAGSTATEFARGEAVKYAALGADVIFAAAGPAGDAALRAAVEAGAAVIGSGADVYLTAFEGGAAPGAERVLASVYLDAGRALATALPAVVAEAPPSGVEPLTVANGGVVMTPLRDPGGRLSPLDVQDIEAIRLRLSDRSLETGVDPATGEER
jgi:basic membrane lipoprotein Med (substrate-binding protein (PBP1-ABC) superfamily)